MTVFVRARVEVRAGRQAEFEEIARALLQRAKDELGTLTYRFFPAGDGAYLVIEEYADAQALGAHQEGAGDLLARVEECAENFSVELYGPIGSELSAWVESNPQATAYPDADFSG
ncbi:MAG TPA: antibiotic biosynthesis monooxygenase family protein [Actinophytocola sp.]|uniref:putative quinol monooxygenase n=1 Tax=Actinophytocola sp. TaxID=1872138 RepID=UPI002E0A5CF5|nr:antibiotic biosynthesis monooxygenase family protein [Actinophytocola sp.]